MSNKWPWPLTRWITSLRCWPVCRTEGPFSDSWQDPNARHYKNVPVHSVDGDTDAAPFSPQGFADIGGGLHGSRQSLNRVSDERPGSRQAAPGSLNRSQDSATGAAAHPRPRGRDAAAARGSNRSLNGFVWADMDESLWQSFLLIWWPVRQVAEMTFIPLTPTVAIWVQRPVLDRVKPSFVIFDIRAFWRSALSVRVPGCQKLQMTT